MATILLAWELGAGMGHLLPLRALGLELIKRGHRVVGVFREAERAQALFEGTGIAVLPAPVFKRPGSTGGKPKVAFAKTLGFAHVLGNCGFADETHLQVAFAAWNKLFDDINPALVVADHSPAALMALWGRPIPRVNLGLPFCCPPDAANLPFWWQGQGREQARQQTIADERGLTEKVDRVLKANGRHEMGTLVELFNKLDDVIVASYKELDPYGDRARYWGHWHGGMGLPPEWPSGGEGTGGKKVYAYLKPFPGVEQVIRALQNLRTPTIVVGADWPQKVRQQWRAKGAAAAALWNPPL